jgi:hypothetical protein
MPYVTLDMARQHTRSQGVPDDADLSLKIAQAEALVWQHLKRDGDPPWTVADDPAVDVEFAVILAATLRVVQNLYRFRGDDPVTPSPMSADVLDLLTMLRDPTVA